MISIGNMPTPVAPDVTFETYVATELLNALAKMPVLRRAFQWDFVSLQVHYDAIVEFLTLCNEILHETAWVYDEPQGVTRWELEKKGFLSKWKLQSSVKSAGGSDFRQMAIVNGRRVLMLANFQA